jgi:hypothetical protein
MTKKLTIGERLDTLIEEVHKLKGLIPTRASKEIEEQIGAALGLAQLPPIYVTTQEHERLQKLAQEKGVVIQALVRYILMQNMGAVENEDRSLTDRVAETVAISLGLSDVKPDEDLTEYMKPGFEGDYFAYGELVEDLAFEFDIAIPCTPYLFLEEHNTVQKLVVYLEQRGVK